MNTPISSCGPLFLQTTTLAVVISELAAKSAEATTSPSPGMVDFAGREHAIRRRSRRISQTRPCASIDPESATCDQSVGGTVRPGSPQALLGRQQQQKPISLLFRP